MTDPNMQTNLPHPDDLTPQELDATYPMGADGERQFPWEQFGNGPFGEPFNPNILNDSERISPKEVGGAAMEAAALETPSFGKEA